MDYVPATFSEPEAQARITELADAQLLHVPDDERAPVKLTEAGRRLHTQIRAAVSQITQRLGATCRSRTWRLRAPS